jgi:hypothetical protein
MTINRARRQLLAASAAAGLVKQIPAAQNGQLSFAPAAFDAHEDRVTLWASASEAMRLLARWRIAGEAAWRDGPALELDAGNDTTGAVTLRRGRRARVSICSCGFARARE